MAGHTLILLLFVALSLGWAIYCEWLIKLRYAPLQFTIALRRTHRKDLGIFIVLLAILFVQQLLHPTSQLTSGLLFGLILLMLWFGWLRQPLVLINSAGIVIHGRFIRWQQIHQYQLTENGDLVLQLANEQMVMSAKNMADLERLYHHVMAQPG